MKVSHLPLEASGTRTSGEVRITTFYNILWRLSIDVCYNVAMDIHIIARLKHLVVLEDNTDSKTRKKTLLYGGKPIHSIADIRNYMGHEISDMFCEHYMARYINEKKPVEFMMAMEKPHDFIPHFLDYCKKLRDDYMASVDSVDMIQTIRHSISLWNERGDRFSDEEYILSMDGLSYTFKESENQWCFTRYIQGQEILNPFELLDIMLIEKTLNMLLKHRLYIDHVRSLLQEVTSGAIGYDELSQRCEMVKTLGLTYTAFVNAVVSAMPSVEEESLHL